MKATDILKLRLYNTGLSNARFKTAAQAVSHLGAVQAQDFPAAKWALGLRVQKSTDATIEKAFNDGTILRTHVLRPTWHFVLPQDIRWMLELTAPAVKIRLAPYDRHLNLDEALFSKSNAAIVRALQRDSNLTRQDLKVELERIGIRTDVQRLAHIVVRAELDGLVCSGPRRGKQFTYALLDHRTPKAKKLAREQAMAKLASTYFRSHGPAQLKDFSWWSGFSMNDARQAIDLIQTELKEAVVDGKTYWSLARMTSASTRFPVALLLSIYDEYTIAYKDRSDLSEGRARDVGTMIRMGNALTAVIILNGKVAGTWKKKIKKNKIEIELNPFREFSKREQQALESEIVRYLKFSAA